MNGHLLVAGLGGAGGVQRGTFAGGVNPEALLDLELVDNFEQLFDRAVRLCQLAVELCVLLLQLNDLLFQACLLYTSPSPRDS